jgi:hypothetical protein
MATAVKIWAIIQHIASDYISNSQHFRICYCRRKSNFSNKYQDFWITLYFMLSLFYLLVKIKIYIKKPTNHLNSGVKVYIFEIKVLT